ncbi:1-hydroxycarotenoid 3,4-desaturase CrtD [Aquimarina brevivitae]|uniref:Phytoene desaturase n=1 Tax=Aquimarina brevivitae TaxID=323412 RepID=A0A4V2F7A1_9FLAO|nr:1-hydroxycarotenoid 3,4-desaturase CrtD [Aquimarina brevivitae]RZS99099.1 phytoene desaturase [Aquimarina brevivitae]
MERKKAVIIGAGIAGLATAVRLTKLGYAVEVFEANSYPGGKLSEIRIGEYRFDAGPSLFTMPQFVEELFTVADVDISSFFAYDKKEIVCQYFYEDGTRFTAYADQELFAKAAEKSFDVKAQDILDYFNKSKRKYNLTASLFLEKSLHKASTYLSADTIKAILNIGSLDINSTLDAVNRKSFSDPNLIQLFNRFATYNGSSPYKTPGIMSMIPHLEQYFGMFLPKGGMYSITQSIYELAKTLGVRFNFNTVVDRILITNGKATGVAIGSKEVDADVVVSNMDIVPTYKKLLADQKQPDKVLNQARSSSALIFYWGIKKTFESLDLHNIFFSANYKKEFDAIFKDNTVDDDPTVYINITSKYEENDAPKGCENWFVMINVPGNTGQDWDQIIEQSRKNIITKISKILNTDIAPLIEVEELLDPRKIERKTKSYQGSLYGASSNDKFAAFLRHPNFSSTIDDLYFCGGSVHPGGGIPLCLLSAKIVSDLVQS